MMIKMEHRIVLTNKEAYNLCQKLGFIETGFVIDKYTGTKRIRKDKKRTTIKIYKTPVKGVVYRFSIRCKLREIENIWFEFKWTEKKSRFEIEFEDKVPEKFQKRKNIPGWDILR